MRRGSDMRSAEPARAPSVTNALPRGCARALCDLVRVQSSFPELLPVPFGDEGDVAVDHRDGGLVVDRVAFQPRSTMGFGEVPLMNCHALTPGPTIGCPYWAVGMHSAVDSAIGLPGSRWASTRRQ